MGGVSQTLETPTIKLCILPLGGRTSRRPELPSADIFAHNPPHKKLRQGTQGNRAAAERSRTTGWGWHGGGNSAGPVDPGDYDTDEANTSIAMLPAIPCRWALRRDAWERSLGRRLFPSCWKYGHPTCFGVVTLWQPRGGALKFDQCGVSEHPRRSAQHNKLSSPCCARLRGRLLPVHAEQTRADVWGGGARLGVFVFAVTRGR